MNTPVAIYMLKNTVTGKVYIGQSVNPEYRIKRHFWKNNGCIKLRNSIQMHGKESFTSKIIYWCSDKPDANEVEQLLIELCDSRFNGYNITPGGFGTGSGSDNPFYGKTHSPEVKAKLVAANVGRVMSEEAKQRIRDANAKRDMSEATKEKLRARPKSELCSQRTAESNRKRVWTVEARAKQAANQLGRKMSEAAKSKIAQANSKRVWSNESRAKLAAAKTKKVLNELH
jgi:group I intron endonuclease